MATIGQNTLSDTFRFHCPTCRAELSVPTALAGVEGPCPSCGDLIHAPIPEAVPVRPQEVPPVPWMAPVTAKQKEFAGRSLPSPGESVETTPLFPSPQDKNFRARLAIPTTEAPLDDTWKERHRDLRRQNRRARKAEEVAQSFLESRAFRVARVLLILISAGMLVWLFTYMQTHQWHLPGMVPGLAREQPAATSGASRPAGGDANVFTADDDTEIPPAANLTPAPADSAKPLAGKPR